MCELFAFSGQRPALLRCSLHEFAQHGGGGRNAEGWGIAHYLDGDVRLLKDAGAARDSACLAFIERHPLQSGLVISHIRHAIQGAATHRNCQPFLRELGGSMHVFAHNGNLDRTALAGLAEPDCYHPVGETDSELAFCALLERLRPLWRSAAAVPPLERRREVVADFARELRALGPANFLYADGDALFAHGHRRTQQDGEIRPPGLFVLCRSCEVGAPAFEALGLGIAPAEQGGPQLMFASVALTPDAAWRPLADGELLVARAGGLINQR